jgi:hypothetical protein
MRQRDAVASPLLNFSAESTSFSSKGSENFSVTRGHDPSRGLMLFQLFLMVIYLPSGYFLHSYRSHRPISSMIYANITHQNLCFSTATSQQKKRGLNWQTELSKTHDPMIQ